MSCTCSIVVSLKVSCVFEKMNGVELPCGTKLQVEPSLSNKKIKSKNARLPQCSESESSLANALNEAPQSDTDAIEPNDDGDLDDFFASL